MSRCFRPASCCFAPLDHPPHAFLDRRRSRETKHFASLVWTAPSTSDESDIHVLKLGLKLSLLASQLNEQPCEVAYGGLLAAGHIQEFVRHVTVKRQQIRLSHILDVNQVDRSRTITS